METIVILFLSIVFFFVLFLLLMMIKNKQPREIARLYKYLSLSNSSIPSEINGKKKVKRKNKAIIGMSKSLERNFKLSNLRQQLLFAGYSVGPGEFLVRTILLAALISCVLFLIFSSALIGVLCFIIGLIVPYILMKRAIISRNKLASLQLIQALGIMANSLRAGYSFLQVIKLISEESPKPLGKEFGKVIQNVNLGLSLEESFAQLKSTFNNPDLEMVLTSILIQRESGGDLSKLLESIQETMIGRLRVKDEVKTLTAQGRLSMYVIICIPAAIGVYLQLVNPDYFQMMFQHPLGWMMLSMAFIGVFLGWIIINKIVSIEV